MIKSSANPQIQKNLLLSDNIYSKCLSLVLNALFWIAKIYELWAQKVRKSTETKILSWLITKHLKCLHLD